MHLADYQTSSAHAKVSPVEGRETFVLDERRHAVVVQALGTNVRIVLGKDPEGAPSYVLGKGERAELPSLYVGPFVVLGAAVVTEFLVHNAGV